VTYAQENGNRDENGKVVRGPYETNKFGDNWFIETGFGITSYIGGPDHNYQTPIHPNFNLNFGKWITPSVGVRIAFGDTPNVGRDDFKFNYWNLHGDFMWNLSNALGGYKETRVYQLIPYIGAGFAQTASTNFVDNSIGALSLNAGLINKFRVSNRIDLNLEIGSAYIKHFVDRWQYGNQWMLDVPMTAIASITFKIGKTNFKRVTAPKSCENVNAAVLESLKAMNADLLAKNKALEAQVDSLNKIKPEKIDKPVYGDIPSMAVVFFEIGKAKLCKKENIHLDNFAYYVKQTIASSGETITLIGSADKQTGNAKINMNLKTR